MKVHANAPLGPKGRLTMVLRVVEQGWSLAQAAEAAGVSDRTCSKWVGRYRQEGRAGLQDRSSSTRSVAHRTPDELVEVIAALRRLGMTGAEIALCLAMALSTVSAVLTRIGLGKISRLAACEPPNRYERRCAGELVHIDVKKLGRIRGGAGDRMLGRGPGRHAGRAAAGTTSASASTTPLAWPTRQGRALSPRPARRLGLRRDLRLKRPTHCTP